MLRTCLLYVAMVSSLLAPGFPHARDAESLRARYENLGPQLANSPFGRPLLVASSGSSAEPRGEIVAVIAQPFARVGPALRRVENWCDILILQANVKHCAVSGGGGRDALAVFIGRTPYDALEQTHRVQFAYEVAAAADDYLQVRLLSPQGPFGTSDYQVRLEAAPVEEGRTFIYLAYSYRLGMGARLAMQTYLATSGRNKVGFTVSERLPDGRPVYVGGHRGVVERNAMRYYLAIEAFLGSLALPAEQRVEKRLRDWHAAIDRYPLQLRELGRNEYLEIKRRDLNRHS